MSRRALLFLRWGVFLAAGVFLYIRLSGHQGIHPAWADWRNADRPVPWLALLAVTVLMIVNWGCEAWKWWWLMRPVQRLSYPRAFKATVVGTSIGLITPNRIGEFAGRVLFLDPGHRVEGGFATLLGSIAQFVVTLLMGGLAIAIGGVGTAIAGPLDQVLAWSTILIGGVAVFLFFSPRVFGRALTALPFLDRFEKQARVLGSYHRGQLLTIFLISVLRYAVFTTQFCVILHVMADVNFNDSLFAVPLVFLVTTLVPTTALTELGIRGSAAAALIPGDPSSVVMAAAIIWVINIVLPAIVGSLMLLVVRIRTTDPI